MLKQARINNCRSFKGVVKIHRIMNERAVSISHESDIKALYPNFAAFKLIFQKLYCEKIP